MINVPSLALMVSKPYCYIGLSEHHFDCVSIPRLRKSPNTDQGGSENSYEWFHGLVVTGRFSASQLEMMT